MIRALPLVAALALLCGCASLAPESLSAVLTHASHITQHAPVCRWAGEPESNYGYQTIGLSARWARGPVWAEVSDGTRVFSGYLAGLREIFEAKAGITLWRNHR